ncbi:hypothetical protein GGR57DRAFT_259319 [Xylariaceae sp. FL1272]|nr:hypothetical protein GGR57DRAFT_259319 [Xylariaceae sp. FL1272]
MAAVSLSPTPLDLSAMSSRRVPLSSNQNVANSPLRNNNPKQKRTWVQLQREEHYGQPPPAKKQVLDAATQRVVKSPSLQPQSRIPTKSQTAGIPAQQRRATSGYDTKTARERVPSRQHHEDGAVRVDKEAFTSKDYEGIHNWQIHHRARFPKCFFYFDQVPTDQAHTFKKQINALGGRVSPFFSIEVTHVVTTRAIPAAISNRDNDKTVRPEKEAPATETKQDQEDTINPSLLTRFNADTSIKRRLFDADLRARAQRIPQPQDQSQALKVQKKSVDILVRANEMKKKIWSVDKLSRMTILLLETDPLRSVELAYGTSHMARTTQNDARGPEDRNLLRMLQIERVNGPSDRDTSVHSREMVHFKGPHIYIWDIEEKQKPIMVKEYPKVADKTDGEWPQFQSASLGRCPFVEDSEAREAREAKKAKARATARAAAESNENANESKPILQPPKMAPPKSVIGKRTVSEMELGHSRQSSVTSVDFPNLSRSFEGGNASLARKAFASHAAAGRVLGGVEPVASGVQPSNVTSAIRSQMVSSTAATPGVITGLSKEVHGLQRQVLKKQTSATASQDLSSRRPSEASIREESSFKKVGGLGRALSRQLEQVDVATVEKNDAEEVTLARQSVLKKTREPKRERKPGYCENCAEKYADFDDHIESKKHRKFADNPENWLELDDLLAQLERLPKRRSWQASPSWTHSPEHGEF